MKLKLLWLVPLVLVLAVIGALLALPGFVAAQSHRPAIEHFASVLTGRRVHIAGQLSLTLLPHPTLTASQITITGPDDEVISARALALDIALEPLLTGQLAVQTLTLDHPVINFPWPLPGGPHAVAPPPWLAALHAHFANASITLGGLAFTTVNADLFTGPDGALSLSGDGILRGLHVKLSLALSHSGLDGAAPLALQISTGAASANFSGTLNGQSQIAGQLSATLPDKTTASATLAADGTTATLTGLSLTQGTMHLSGSASLALRQPSLQASLIGQNLDLDRLGSLPDWAAAVPAAISLSADGVSLLGQNFPSLSVKLHSDADGMSLRGLNLALPGGGALSGDAALAANGKLSGQLHLTVPDSAGLLTAYHLPALPNWPSARLSATLAGSSAQPALQALSGTLGQDHVTGTLVLSPYHAAGVLNFDHLSLAPLLGWAGHAPGRLSADLEVNAAKAEAGPVKLTKLALDAELNGTLNVRHVSASLYGGLAAGSFVLDSSGHVVLAQGFLDIPTATPLAALIPAAYAPPAALLAAPLTVNFAARGPANALATSAVARLGQFTITASPVIDITTGAASGALTVQHPEAILVARLLGADQQLVFPGAGSMSLRARFSMDPHAYGLRDFILNFGALNASGRLMVQNGTVSGRIDAGTVLVPPIPLKLQFPASLPLPGKLALHAQQIIYNGHPLLGPSAANLHWSAAGASLDVASASLGGGTLSGSVGMALSATAAPAFTARLLAQNIDANALALPLPFPYPLASGTLNGNAQLAASGYGLKSVLATLAGTASLDASKGVLRGFDLAKFARTLGTAGAPHGLYRALVSGATPFAQLKLGMNLADGNATLTSASLNGPAGQVNGSGGIDLFDKTQALKLEFTPAGVAPPVSGTMLVLGSWATPKYVPHLQPALDWKPLPPPPAPATH